MRIYLTRRECELILQQLSYEGLDTREKLELLKVEVRVKDVCTQQMSRDKSTFNGVLALENLMDKEKRYGQERQF